MGKVIRLLGPMAGTILLVVIMLQAAQWTNKPELIFPEISALAIGAFVYKEYKWIRRPWQIWFAPTLAAAIGVSLNRLNLNLLWKETLCLVVVTTMIHWIKTNIGPTISAGLLPIALGIDSWIFVLSVCIMTLIIMVGVKCSYRTIRSIQQEDNSKRYTWAYVCFMFVWIGFCYALHLHFWVIPPILVVAYETIHRESVRFRLGYKQVVLLTSSALIGSMFLYFMPTHDIQIGICDVVIVYCVSKLLRIEIAPSYAISLLPLILPEHNMWSYPFSVFITSLTLLMMVIFYRKKEQMTLAGKSQRPIQIENERPS